MITAFVRLRIDRYAFFRSDAEDRLLLINGTVNGDE